MEYSCIKRMNECVFFVRTSSKRFCKSGIDFVLTAPVVPVVFGVGVVAAVAPLPDAVADPEAFDGDSDEAGGVAAAPVPAV